MSVGRSSGASASAIPTMLQRGSSWEVGLPRLDRLGVGGAGLSTATSVSSRRKRNGIPLLATSSARRSTSGVWVISTDFSSFAMVRPRPYYLTLVQTDEDLVAPDRLVGERSHHPAISFANDAGVTRR